MFQGFLALLGWESVRVIHGAASLCRPAPPPSPQPGSPDSALPLCVFTACSLEATCEEGGCSCQTGVGVAIFSWKVVRLSAERRGMSPKACWQ